MKLLRIIKFRDLKLKEIESFKLREATRAIVFDEDNKIALLQVTNHNYHKLPGGGIERGEHILPALKRECLEETGSKIEIIKEVGLIIEYRDKFKKRQQSYCYIAKLIGDKGEPNFTKKEIQDGFKLKWVKLEEAIKLLENDSPNDYQGKFIKIRDSTYLKKARSLI
jgi:ADP-ribose pyrophosphatase YjhB (NUDIX family)